MAAAVQGGGPTWSEVVVQGGKLLTNGGNRVTATEKGRTKVAGACPTGKNPASVGPWLAAPEQWAVE